MRVVGNSRDESCITVGGVELHTGGVCKAVVVDEAKDSGQIVLESKRVRPLSYNGSKVGFGQEHGGVTTSPILEKALYASEFVLPTLPIVAE